MAEPYVAEIVEALLGLVPVAFERLEREGDKNERGTPMLYLRSDAERLTLMIWRGTGGSPQNRDRPWIAVAWYEFDENGVGTYPKVGWSGDYSIPLSDTPPYTREIYVENIWRWNLASVIEEFRALQPEMFRRATRAIRNGRKTTQDDHIEPYLKNIANDLGLNYKK